MIDANKNQLDLLRNILELNKEKFSTEVSIKDYMENHKTEWALKVFDTKENINFPQYIIDAINWEYKLG